MRRVSVIIPFYQRESGILARALKSVQSQRVPDGWRIDVLVVDDGSPVKAADEILALQFVEPFHLTLVCKDNGGVGSARNCGLLEAENSATLIAFLDSDDCWPDNHLLRAIQAVDEGYDFYFTDNRRPGHHDTYLRSPYLPLTAALLDRASQKTGLLEIPVDAMIGLTLKEMPCQASTVVYRGDIGKKCRFDVALKHSGEDVLFFSTVVAHARRVCLDLDSMVDCGSGVNIYFANLNWDADRFLSITVDHLIMHRVLARRVPLSRRNSQMNDGLIAKCRIVLAYHMARSVMKTPARACREYLRLAHMSPTAALLLQIDVVRVACTALLRPDKLREALTDVTAQQPQVGIEGRTCHSDSSGGRGTMGAVR